MLHEQKRGGIKQKMKYLKKLYGKTVIDSSNNEEMDKSHKIELEYYQIKSNTEGKPYGIEIVKKNRKNEKMNIENSVIYNIYSEEKDNNNLIEKLMKNKVTPVALNDVVEDLLSQ